MGNDDEYLQPTHPKSIPYFKKNISLTDPCNVQRKRKWNPFIDHFTQLGIIRPKPNVFIKIPKQTLEANKTSNHKKFELASSHYKKDDNIIKYPSSDLLPNLKDQRKENLYNFLLIALKNPHFFIFPKQASFLHQERNSKDQLYHEIFKDLYDNHNATNDFLKSFIDKYPSRPALFADQFGINSKDKSKREVEHLFKKFQLDIIKGANYFSYKLTRIIQNPQSQRIIDSRSENMKEKNDSLPNQKNGSILFNSHHFTVNSHIKTNNLNNNLNNSFNNNLNNDDDRPKVNTINFVSDIEDSIDEMDFRLAIKKTQIMNQKFKKVTMPISNNKRIKPLISSTPSDQGFVNIYTSLPNEKTQILNSTDFVPRLDILSFIGFKISKGIQDQTEFTKQEVLSYQHGKRQISHRHILKKADMYFEKRKQDSSDLYQNANRDNYSMGNRDNSANGNSNPFSEIYHNQKFVTSITKIEFDRDTTSKDNDDKETDLSDSSSTDSFF
ncbi:hypothetical protein TRFO_39465 [Tritrichomonas foetus]|uniref:Uncharacterized protein n=1 Tax=Tritrichomonas foetus TaxID=1144522 RepID=A0A1J4J9E9_9EUKA|nr:hypothetical protein TRFO_39465 [Tritrichomonas foetus]|eukprot:OHS94307.1 hypothetical protein TRFO_39465 [Tritrichomonas foetus]